MKYCIIVVNFIIFSLLSACYSVPSDRQLMDDYYAKKAELAKKLSVPSKEFVSTWDFSDKPTMNEFQKLVKAEMENILIDPYSAKYYFEQPLYKTYHYDYDKLDGYHYEENIFVYGWGAYFYVNAKNKMGGYVGKTPYKAIVNKGKIVYIHENHGADGLYEVDDLYKMYNINK